MCDTPDVEQDPRPSPFVTDEAASALEERLWTSVLGALETLTVYLGDRLGYYRTLSRGNGSSAAELASATGTDPRMAREWLTQQVAAGIVIRDRASEPAMYRLREGHAEVLLNPDREWWPTAATRFVATLDLEALASAFVTGTGLSWTSSGQGVLDPYMELMRPSLLDTVPALISRVPGVDGRLAGQSRIADLGCRHGWGAIGLARRYPRADVEGFDSDEPSLAAARSNAEREGCADRVSFHRAEGLRVHGADPFDVVFAFEALHHAPDPAAFLRAVAELAAEDGIAVVIEPTPGDVPAVGDEGLRTAMAMSVLCCLPDAMAGAHRAPTGTLIEPELMADLADSSGLRAIDLAATDGTWNVYTLER